MAVAWLAAALSWLGWLACLGAAAWTTWRHDGLVALGPERILGPLVMAAAILPVALVVEAQRWVLARRVPLWSAAVGLVPPALLFGLVWVPALQARVALPAEAPATPARGPSVVLVTLDTVRADHVGAISDAGFTPKIDALAKEGATFSQAVTTAPLSGPAHASMFTGRGVLEHGLTMNGAAVKMPTVVDTIRARGYRTGAFLSAQVLDRDTGLHIGFEHYDDRFGVVQRLLWLPAVAELRPTAAPPRRDGAETVERALQWFGSSGDPALMWVHLFDAHGPYNPPLEFQPPSEALDEARRMDREDMRTKQDVQMIGNRGRSRVREQTLLYGASVRWVDALVGRLVAKLPEDTIVIVLADHGENLGEHDYFFSHGGEVWEQAIHVPMVVRWPGRFAPGTRVEGLTSVAAVRELLEQATGLAPVAELAPPSSVFVYTTGQDARRLTDEESVLSTRSPPAAAVRHDGRKVSQRGTEAPVYYDLVADPAELAPQTVPPELQNDVTMLQQILAQPVPRLDAAQRERLEALGYAE